jgi:hypothetical protein
MYDSGSSYRKRVGWKNWVYYLLRFSIVVATKFKCSAKYFRKLWVFFRSLEFLSQFSRFIVKWLFVGFVQLFQRTEYLVSTAFHQRILLQTFMWYAMLRIVSRYGNVQFLVMMANKGIIFFLLNFLIYIECSSYATLVLNGICMNASVHIRVNIF